jgi:elongation factor 1-gamma
MPYKIYSVPNNPRAWKGLIAAKYAGIEVETTPDFKMGVDNKTPEFLAKNPLGKIPVLETDDGFIFESNTIARHFAKKSEIPLFGNNEYEEALVNQWIDFATNEIDLPAGVWIYPIFGFVEFSAEATNLAKGDIRKVLQILNDFLATRTFLVGERISLADIIVFLSFVNLYKLVLDTGFRKPFVHVTRWFTTIANQPHVQEVVGEVTLATKMAVAPGKEGAAPEKKEEKKQKQPKPAEPKKEKKEKPKKEAEEEEEENFNDPEPAKGSNPLDQLPQTPFVLDEWKRQYSNNDGAVSIKWFFDNIDKEGWSVWFCDYLYNKEQTQLFMTCNLVGGFLQRLDKLRKYGFGSVLIFENEADKIFEISGVWLFRGLEVPAEMKGCDDYELYSWKRADLDNEDDKKKITELFNWEGHFDGRKFSQGKIFK